MTRCRTCNRRFRQSGKGRPRVDCPDCRPPGSTRASLNLETFCRRSERRARHAAKAAAARRVARACPDLFAFYLADEYERRGVAA